MEGIAALLTLNNGTSLQLGVDLFEIVADGSLTDIQPGGQDAGFDAVGGAEEGEDMCGFAMFPLLSVFSIILSICRRRY